jgi:hypothetical protein
MFWTIVSLTVIGVHFFRRYKTQNYATQKFSRRNDYMRKTEFSPLKVNWNVKFEDYKPLGKIRVTRFWWFDRTNIDGKKRLLIEVSPYTFCCAPFNPFGRTGIIGEGLFPHTGPNYQIFTIVWSRTLGFLKMMHVRKGNFFSQGYLDHPLNTDNAWIEADIYHLEVQEFVGHPETCPEWLQTSFQQIQMLH